MNEQNCFFCNKGYKTFKIIESENFYSRYDDFPISPGHAEVVSKKHTRSFFGLDKGQASELYSLICDTKEIIVKRFKPKGFNIGVNEGEAAGQTISHLHIHLIPRYRGDCINPVGGIRNIFPDKANYLKKKK